MGKKYHVVLMPWSIHPVVERAPCLIAEMEGRPVGLMPLENSRACVVRNDWVKSAMAKLRLTSGGAGVAFITPVAPAQQPSTRR